MAATSIQWCDHSINPIRFGKGHFCQKISPGCANCYASRLQPRFGSVEFKGVGGRVPHRHPAQNLTVADPGLWFDESKLAEVLRRKKPTRYFWCDMTDIFGAWVPDEWIDRCFATMALTPQHTHQVLTKRPERMRDYFNGCVVGEKKLKPSLGKAVLEVQNGTIECDIGGPNGLHRLACLNGLTWPIPNVWLGVSVEDQQRADERIPLLLQCPAAVRFLSCEPLLGPLRLFEDWWCCSSCGKVGNEDDEVGMGRCDGCGHEIDDGNDLLPEIDWVIIGGESGPGARPMDLAWARSIVAQCRAGGVACFVKQLGAKPFDGEAMARVPGATKTYTAEQAKNATPEMLSVLQECLEAGPLSLIDRKGGDMAEWPVDLRLREFPR